MDASTSQRLDASTREYGLIGYPLTHSFSPGYFAEKFEREHISASYETFPIESIQELPALLKAHSHLRGLNITTPYKEQVLPYLDEMSEDARAIGAVNCITIRDGKLSGYNTDWIGFRDSLLPLLTPRYWPALILGNGGASRAIQYALQQLSIAYTIVSRKEGPGILSYADVTPSVVESHPLIINTTTLGTLGEGLPALPYEAITRGHLLYDLVYNPTLTPFLAKGQEQGATIKNGMEMLHLQADASWQIWQQSA